MNYSKLSAEKSETIQVNRWCVDAIELHVDLSHCSVGTTATKFCVDFFVILLAISLEHRHSFCELFCIFGPITLVKLTIIIIITISYNNKSNNKQCHRTALHCPHALESFLFIFHVFCCLNFVHVTFGKRFDVLSDDFDRFRMWTKHDSGPAAIDIYDYRARRPMTEIRLNL